MGDSIVHVVGARPNFMKAAPVIDGLAEQDVKQLLVHTGQHYDRRMSHVFFDELGLPEPDINLGVGSGSHAEQTAALLTELERVFVELGPTIVVLYGDVNSTLAAALVASKLGIRIAHVEAGLRSFDMTMPEEVNRRLTDALSDLLLVTSPEAIGHLAREGCDGERVSFVGNPMIDTLLRTVPRLDGASLREGLGISGEYGVVTLHRPANVDDLATTERLVGSLGKVAAAVPLVFPLHPRGRGSFEAAGLSAVGGVSVLEPLGYIDFLTLMRDARLVITDSGGIQEETTMLGVPCLTLRPNTERPITLSHGTNRLTDADRLPTDAERILRGEQAFPVERPPLWDGAAGARIATRITAELS